MRIFSSLDMTTNLGGLLKIHDPPSILNFFYVNPGAQLPRRFIQ